MSLKPTKMTLKCSTFVSDTQGDFPPKWHVNVANDTLPEIHARGLWLAARNLQLMAPYPLHAYTSPLTICL